MAQANLARLKGAKSSNSWPSCAEVARPGGSDDCDGGEEYGGVRSATAEGSAMVEARLGVAVVRSASAEGIVVRLQREVRQQ